MQPKSILCRHNNRQVYSWQLFSTGHTTIIPALPCIQDMNHLSTYLQCFSKDQISFIQCGIKFTNKIERVYFNLVCDMCSRNYAKQVSGINSIITCTRVFSYILNNHFYKCLHQTEKKKWSIFLCNPMHQPSIWHYFDMLSFTNIYKENCNLINYSLAFRSPFQYSTFVFASKASE
jgi:hypothetical protein